MQFLLISLVSLVSGSSTLAFDSPAARKRNTRHTLASLPQPLAASDVVSSAGVPVPSRVAQP